MQQLCQRVDGQGSLGVSEFAIGLAPNAVLAQSDTFMLVPGIPGGSVTEGHPAWIEVTSLSNAWPVVEGKKQSACEIRIVKGLDIAGPLLWAAAVSNQTFDEIHIEVMKSGEVSTKVYDILLNNVRITHIVTSGDTTFAETVGFAATSMTLTFIPQNPDGSSGVPVSSVIHCG